MIDGTRRTRLTAGEAETVLSWLGVPVPRSCTRAWLDRLLAAYVQRVPWESASRVARRASASTPADAVQWPAVFWEAAMTQGLGGTCFESNLAVAALLEAVGIAGTLTINDRPPIRACHTALVVAAEGDRVVVDAGFPIHAAIPLPRGSETCEVTTPWGTYCARSTSDGERILIGQRPHPVPLAFELVDRAVSPEAYAAATRADYGPTGLFLDVVVIKKVIDGDVWRFTSGERPWQLERFRAGVRHTVPLASTSAPEALSAYFGLDRDVVARALAMVTAAPSTSRVEGRA